MARIGMGLKRSRGVAAARGPPADPPIRGAKFAESLEPISGVVLDVSEGVPKARPVFENVTYLIGRRTSQQFFRFPPMDAMVMQIFMFCVGYAASLTGVQVHAFILMSDHYHITITDVHGLVPKFFNLLNANMALLIKRHFDLPEEIWNKSQTSMVDLSSDEVPAEMTVVQKIAYTIGNATSSGLLKHWYQWPGAQSKPEDIGTREYHIKRPACASARTELPSSVTWKLDVPPSLAHWSHEQRVQAIGDALQELSAKARSEFPRPMGLKEIAKQGIEDRPYRRAKRERKLNPRFAGDAERRKIMVAILQAFDDDYDGAREGYCAGNHSVVFPRGTWSGKDIPMGYL